MTSKQISICRMFSRKLLALGYPDTLENFDDDKSFQDLVIWLESKHIKCLAKNELDNLKKHWESKFDDYLKALHAPYNSSSERNSIVSWLLGRAVQQAYNSQSNELKSLNADNWISSASSDNPLLNMDFDSEAFVQLSLSLSKLLSIPPCSDHKEMINAACMLVVERLKAAHELTKSSHSPKRAKQSQGSAASVIPLHHTPLGFDANDKVLNDMAKILRLQHINELRELQTAIDEAIVTVQKITANPKTDTRLGKHGF